MGSAQSSAANIAEETFALARNRFISIVALTGTPYFGSAPRFITRYGLGAQLPLRACEESPLISPGDCACPDANLLATRADSHF